MRTATLFLLAVLAAAPWAYAQDVEVSAAVDRRHVSPGESISYTVVVESNSRPNVQTPRPPSAPELTLPRQDPRSSRNISVINGRIQQRISFQWTFRVNSEGSPRIGSTTVVVNGVSYETDPITLESSSSSASSGTDGDTREIQGIFIAARPSRTTVYSGQQVTVEYVLYFRDGLHVENSRMAGPWKADGLWREELDVERHPVPGSEVVDGVRYQTVTLKRVAVFPTHDGTFEIDPLAIETEVQRTGSGLQSFPFNRLRDHLVVSTEVASDPVTIRARARPGGAPPAYSGAVGSFEMDVTHRAGPPQVGSAFEIHVQIEGTGNISTLAAPELNLPASFDVFDPEVDQQINRSGDRLRGRKTFVYPVVPEEAGTHQLPAVHFAYFDPAAATYRTLESEARTVDVRPSPDPPTAEDADPERTLGGPLGPEALKEGEGGAVSEAAPPLHLQAWPYALLGGPALIAAGLFLLLVRRRRPKGGAEERLEAGRISEHLERAETLREEGRARAFYEEIDRAVRTLVSRHVDPNAAGMSQEELRRVLEGSGAPTDAVDRVVDLLEECEQARFSPDPPGATAMDTAADRAAACMEELDRIWASSEETVRA